MLTLWTTIIVVCWILFLLLLVFVFLDVISDGEASEWLWKLIKGEKE